MIGGGRVLAVIAARGGSKGVPGKNVREVGGKPLIAWTIEAAKSARLVDRVIVSSDDRRIIEVAEQHGCEAPFVREPALATDEASSIDVVLDAAERVPGYEWVVLLQPTSPLRTAADIDGALEACVAANAPACVSVREAEESPYWMYERVNGRLAPVIERAAITRRQDLPAVFVLNGAVYVARTNWLRETRAFVTRETAAYVMPAARSLDIDTESDFQELDGRLRAIAGAS